MTYPQQRGQHGGYPCADATDSVDEAITLIGQTGGAELSETKEIAKDQYVVVVTISYQGTSGLSLWLASWRERLRRNTAT